MCIIPNVTRDVGKPSKMIGERENAVVTYNTYTPHDRANMYLSGVQSDLSLANNQFGGLYGLN